MDHVARAPDASRAFTAYLDQLVEDIIEKETRASFPDAVRFFLERRGGKPPRARAGLDIRLRIPVPGPDGVSVQVDLAPDPALGERRGRRLSPPSSTRCRTRSSSTGRTSSSPSLPPWRCGWISG